MQYDPFSAAFQADPFPVYKWMRDQAPVYYSEKWDWWAFPGSTTCARRPWTPRPSSATRAWTSTTRPRTRADLALLPDLDNPRHDRVRSIIQPFFLPRRIAELEAGVRATVRELVGRVARPGRSRPGAGAGLADAVRRVLPPAWVCPSASGTRSSDRRDSSSGGCTS